MPVVNNLLLAFGFASPWLLGGLALAGIPIIIHLLHRRRFRETPWAAMRFLIEAARKNSRRIRLEQLLLLAVRAGLLVLLSLALARPYAESLGTGGAAAAPVHRIIVLDASLSMGWNEPGTNRFERARTLARQIVDDARPGDPFNLVLIRGRAPAVIIRQPSFQPEQVLDELDQLRATDERGDVAAALAAAAELATLLPEIPRKQITFVSDFQRDNWRLDGADPGRDAPALLAGLAQKSEVVLLDVKQETGPNAAVVSFEAGEPVPIAGRDVPLRGILRNFGDRPLAGKRVELHVDGRLADTRTVDLPPATDVPVEFHPLFRDSGDHLLELKLDDDPLTADNRRLLALPVRDELRVLLVNGRAAGKPAEAVTFYLETVLSPSTARESWSGATRPRVISDGELAGQNLDQYDCVCLCNVRLVTEREAAILHDYVERGGGLIVWLGDRVQAENYNQMLYREGKGVLPALLHHRVGNAREARDAFGFNAENLEHPLLGRFRGNPGTGLETTLTLEYFRVSADNRPDSQVVLRFDSGDPAIVEAAVGQGRSVLVTTSADLSWGTWPVQRSFPPLVHEMVLYALAGRSGERQRLVGEPIVRPVAPGERIATVTVTRPDGRDVPLPSATRDSAAGQMIYDETERSGAYRLNFAAPVNRAETFAVNVDPRESDLSALEVEPLRTELATMAGGAAQADVPLPAQIDAARSGRGLAAWLLLGTLCLLFVEQVMAWRFSYGLFLLCLCLASGITLYAFAWHNLLGLAALAICGAGLAGAMFFYRRPFESSSTSGA